MDLPNLPETDRGGAWERYLVFALWHVNAHVCAYVFQMVSDTHCG